MRRCLKTDMIKADKENNIFGALKLIEQLYLDGEISGYVFRNILQEYKDNVCIALHYLLLSPPRLHCRFHLLQKRKEERQEQVMYGLNSDFQKRDVAIYARVSTEHEAQLSALENQIDWYKPILEARPDWTLTAQYIDEGITGTSAEKRPRFMQMIEDARQRKFNMIITREVSRFARNTVDTLQYTRLLKEYGVEVFFINDNIKTFDCDGELRLTIMATLAQDESRKTSIRVKAGQQTSMQNGVFYGNGNILGYDRVGKEMVINPEQAKTVRMIYDMYLSGMGVTAIQYELEKAGRLTAMGKERWFASYIAKMLRNSFYCGIITYHKEYTPDFLKQKKIKNYGDLEYIQVQGTHEPIVTVEEYEQVQKLMNAKSVLMKNHNKGKRRVGRMQHTTAFGRLMICSTIA